MNSTLTTIDHLLNGPLNETEVEHFLTKGYVKIAGAFDAGPCSEPARWIDESWGQAGIDPNDMSTWPDKVTRVKTGRKVLVREFAPRVQSALAQLMGGDSNAVDPSVYGGWAGDGPELTWAVEFLVNYQWGWDKPWVPPGPDAIGWHVDGNWFDHFLDSPEQGLLLVVCWADMVHECGATFIATDSIGPTARYLRKHPEGVGPDEFSNEEITPNCHDFMEVTANAGDVFLMHPFMLHASSYNKHRRPRFMTNPAVSRAEPMRFSRADGKYDAMELAVLRALGEESIDFQITGERRRFHPEG